MTKLFNILVSGYNFDALANTYRCVFKRERVVSAKDEKEARQFAFLQVHAEFPFAEKEYIRRVA